jgi:hypothetical protein
MCGEVALLQQDIPTLEWYVDKFHLGSHVEECADNNSLNHAKSVGRFSGELVETPWSEFNQLKYSTREMTFGGRRAVICDAIDAWNWAKIIKMGASSWEGIWNTWKCQVFQILAYSSYQRSSKLWLTRIFQHQKS